MKNEEIKVSIFHHWRDAVWTSGRKALPGKAVDFKDAAKPRGLVILCDRVLDGPLPGDAGKASVLREAVATEFLPEEQS